jgi:hypothetical protein
MKLETQDAKPEREWPDRPKEDAFWGLAGAVVNAIEPHTESDPAALLLQFLTAAGNLMGRQAYFQVEASQHFPLLYVVIVGSTSKARKGTAWSHVRNLLACVDEVWAADRIQGGLSSGEGLIQAVSDDGAKDRRLLILEPEFASVLQVMARQGNTISAILRQAWDSGDIRTLTRIPLHATGTHISFVGHITNGELLALLNSTEAGNGFGNRFLWTCAARSKRLPHGGSVDVETATILANSLREVFEWLSEQECPLRIIWDDDAKELWEHIYVELSEGKPGMFGAVTSRAEAYVVRLALIYALLDRSTVIWKEHLLAALAVWKYCESSARFVFGDALGDPVADAIFTALRQTPKGLARTQINRLFSGNRTAMELDNALNLLSEQGRAKRTRESGGTGRPAEHWVAVGA